jgi:hypothetical protein
MISKSNQISYKINLDVKAELILNFSEYYLETSNAFISSCILLTTALINIHDIENLSKISSDPCGTLKHVLGGVQYFNSEIVQPTCSKFCRSPAFRDLLLEERIEFYDLFENFNKEINLHYNSGSTLCLELEVLREKDYWLFKEEEFDLKNNKIPKE